MTGGSFGSSRHQKLLAVALCSSWLSIDNEPYPTKLECLAQLQQSLIFSTQGKDVMELVSGRETLVNWAQHLWRSSNPVVSSSNPVISLALRFLSGPSLQKNWQLSDDFQAVQILSLL